MVEKPRKESGRAPPHADNSMTCAKRIVCMVELHEILPPTLAMIVEGGISIVADNSISYSLPLHVL